MALESIAWFLVKDTLICIDDIERAGSNLSLKDVLGLISYLKENRNCKFVLLLNDEVNEDTLEEYKKYREKILDIELTFSPTPEECAEIAITPQTKALRFLQEFSISLGISNIRTINKIKRLVMQSEDLLKDYSPELLREVVHSLTLFTYCFYRSGDEKIPTLDFVINIGSKLFGLGDNNPDIDSTEQAWYVLLKKYGYYHTSELDIVLKEAVQTGYFPDHFLIEAEKKNGEITRAKSVNDLRAAWDIYHNSFKNNQDELLSVLTDTFTKNAQYLSPQELYVTIKLFRELNHSTQASELIDIYIAKNSERPYIFDLESYPFANDIQDNELKQKFEAIFKKVETQPSIKEVLSKMAYNNGWSPIDEQVLAETSPNEYKEFFLSEESPDLHNYIMAALKFREYTESDHRSSIVNNVETALKEIASISELNRRRVRKFGISIDDE